MLRRQIDLPPFIDPDMFKLYRELRQGEFVIVFVDTAGEGSDYNAGQFLAKKALDIPMIMHYKGSIVDVTPQIKVVLEWIADTTGVPPCVAYETNNGGGYELERLSRLNRDQKYIIYHQYKLDPQGNLIRTDKLGWNTNSSTRPAMLKGVEELVNNRLVTIYDHQTITEMFSFVKHKTPSGWKAEAEVGTNDDCFVKRTMILTNNGQVPIEKIKVGDLVMTRAGYKPVIMTRSRRKHIVKNRMLGLTGTPNHPIITTQGIVGLDSVSASDTIYIWNEKQSSIEERNITDIQPQNIGITGSTIGNIPLMELLSHYTKRRVYNLQIADNPEYFANNILVHNCIMSLAGVWQLFQTEEATPPMDQLLRMLPKDDVPAYAKSFGVGTGNTIVQADSSNPFGRPVNPLYDAYGEEENPFDNRGRIR